MMWMWWTVMMKSWWVGGSWTGPASLGHEAGATQFIVMPSDSEKEQYTIGKHFKK